MLTQQLKKVWEYNISYEIHDGERKGYGSWNIIAEEPPQTGWALIFKLLTDRGDMAQVGKITSGCCYERDLVFLAIPGSVQK